MRGFRKVLEATGLYDIGCQGDGFTWSNKNSDATFIDERLDRVVPNNLWISTFYDTNVSCLTT